MTKEEVKAMMEKDAFITFIYTRWGSGGNTPNYFPTKTKAVAYGREMKREGFAHSYIVYNKPQYNNYGKCYRTIAARG